MVLNNHTWEEQTRRLLAEATSELNELESKRRDLDNTIVNLTRTVQAYDIALKDYLIRSGQPNAVIQNWLKELAKPKLKHRDRLKIIAEHNGGKVRTNKATDILFNNKLIKSKKRVNAYVIVQGILAGMVDKGEFKKIAPGEFQLTQQSLLK